MVLAFCGHHPFSHETLDAFRILRGAAKVGKLCSKLCQVNAKIDLNNPNFR